MSSRALILLFLLTSLASCMSTAPALRIPAEVVVPFDDYEDWYLYEELIWSEGALPEGSWIAVPSGFVTDYASIPAAAQVLIPKNGPYSRAALVHDYLYWRGADVCTREQADMVMFLGMYEQDACQEDRDTIYAQLSNFGAVAWNRNRAERREGLPRVIPSHMFDDLRNGPPGGAHYRSWDEFRPRVQGEYLNLGAPEPVGVVSVDWEQVEARFTAIREREAAPWWAIWEHLKFWKW